mmetsp:Transcript_14743/g.33122  ORF Transcript_14743/g.33122 Transcript_14743/m.33122 type:complete len:251 (+) Transcript_14743:132-884(+)
MEEDDELLPEPDSRGYLNISNRAWVTLDPRIWTMSLQIMKLDMSYNHIIEIPPQIGELIMLRELIASFNKINNLPPQIGKLKRLRRLLLNSNKIKHIPEDIGQLDMLEEFVISENQVEEVPVSISLMSNLKEEIDCSNNPLEVLPAKWRGDTESVIFTCRVHRDYSIRMSEMSRSNADLSRHSQVTEQDSLLMKEKVSILYAQIDSIKKNMSKKQVRKMEAAEKLAHEQTLLDLGSEKDRKKGGFACVIC